MYREKLYKKYFSSTKKSREDLEKVFNLSLPLHSAIKLPSDLNSRIIDIGCGTGAFLNTLRKKGYNNIEGVEKGEEQIEFLKIKGLIVHNDDILHFLNNCQKTYDLITLFDVLEHFNKNEIVEIIPLLKEMLSENGCIVIRVPNAEAVLKGSIMYGDFTHETFFTHRSILQIFRTFGFSEVAVFPVEGMSLAIKARIKYDILKLYFRFYRFLLSIDNSASLTYFIPSQNILGIIKK